MTRVEMDEEHSGISTTAHSRSRPTDHVSSISDLPQEVMEIIFENLDSISRKHIERVCKGWMQIIRGVRKFRTHLLIQLPSFYFSCVHNYWQPAYYEDWCARVGNLIKPDQVALHLIPPPPPTIPVHIECFQPNQLVEKNGLHSVLLALRRAGADLSTVDIVFSDCTIECELGLSMLTDTKRIRIYRANITARTWFGNSTLYFDELWLETPDKLPGQIAKLFLAENGPLTEAQSDLLGKLEKHVGRLFRIGPQQDIGFVHDVVNDISHMKRRRYVDGYNWTEALTTIVNGGHVSKHTADYLGLLLPELFHTIITYL